MGCSQNPPYQEKSTKIFVQPRSKPTSLQFVITLTHISFIFFGKKSWEKPEMLPSSNAATKEQLNQGETLPPQSHKLTVTVSILANHKPQMPQNLWCLTSSGKHPTTSHESSF